MIDLSRHVRAGDGVAWSQACAEPTPLVTALFEQVRDIGEIEVFCGLTLGEWAKREIPPEVNVKSFGAMGALGRVADSGRLQIVPANFSALPGLFAERRLPCDVVFLQVSPAGRDGFHTLGIGVDYIADALAHARAVIAEVNVGMPTTLGGPILDAGQFVEIIETDRPLLEPPVHHLTAVEAAIARNVASLVDDEDTIQIGIGAIPAAVLTALEDHRDLGVHSGIVTDGVLDLVEAGVVTGAYKEVDDGMVTAGSALGTARLHKTAGSDPFRFRPSSYTHARATLARLHRFVSVNSALQVDLNGQVNAQSIGGKWRGGIGGQADFSGAAAAGDGRSIIALRATDSKGQSTIVARLDRGLVTTPGAEVEFVVTEHGVADLRGKTTTERSEALIAVASPEHLEALTTETEDG